MSDPITVTDLTQVGRTNAFDPSQPKVFVSYPADFTSNADVTLDFTLLNQAQQFGVPRALFIDNGTNPSEVVVSVTLTNQVFSVPANAEGYFKLDAAINSTIRFVTDGGATEKVTITIYNHDVAPNVWYKFGPTNIPNPLPVTIPDGDDIAEGTTSDAAYTGSGNASVIALLKGLWASFFNVASGSTDSGNPVKIGGRYNSTLPTFSNGQRGDVQLTSRGSVNVQLMDGAANAINAAAPSADALATSGIALFMRSINYLFNGSTFDRQKKPNSNNRLLSAAASTNATLCKAGATDLFRIRGRNNAAAVRYLKIYNKATAPTIGTDVPVMTYYLPANSDYEIEFPTPFYFSLGLGFGLTVNAADADTTALAAGDIVTQNISYQ